MSQQHILLRKANESLNSLIGQSFNQKSKFEAERILDEIHSVAQDRLIGKKTLCYATDKGEIKGVGGSTLLKDRKTGQIVSNLVLDQFGIFLAGIFKSRTTGVNTIIIKDTGGTDRSVRMYSSTGTFNEGTPIGMEVQIGSGTTPPVRTDVFLETPFITTPEAGAFAAVSNPVWNSGQGTFKYAATISAGDSGTINEAIMRAAWGDIVPQVKIFTLFHDAISPGVVFVSGQSITVEYTIQM